MESILKEIGEHKLESGNVKQKSSEKKIETITNAVKVKQQPTISQNSVLSTHTFEADYNDHFATPNVAYTDIFDLLVHLAAELKKPVFELVIYDPYYCDGKMKVLLNDMGFPHVINENRDFYKDIVSNKIPGESLCFVHILLYLNVLLVNRI